MGLEVVDLVAGYGKIRILNGLSINVPEGTIVGVLGANGAGKTTLLRAIAGFNPLWGGSVAVDGKDVSRTDPEARARNGLCLIPEGRAVFGGLTVAENIAVHAQSRSVDAAMGTVCAVFPVLGNRLGQLADTLSGGEQQMLAVSRALIRRPGVVLADELSFGLAPLMVDIIFKALIALRDTGSAVVIVEQYEERLLAAADYAYVLEKGRILTEGPAEALVRTRNDWTVAR